MLTEEEVTRVALVMNAAQVLALAVREAQCLELNLGARRAMAELLGSVKAVASELGRVMQVDAAAKMEAEQTRRQVTLHQAILQARAQESGLPDG